MKIEPVKTSSLHGKVKKALYKYIYSLDLKRNNKLPDEENLAKMLGVSRITLRGVLSELSQEGIILRKHGKGTFLNPEAMKLKVRFNPAQEYEKAISNSGYTPAVHIIEIKTIVSKTINQKLKLAEESEVVLISKLFFANKKPAIYTLDYIPKRIIANFNNLEPDDFSICTFNFLQIYAGKEVKRDFVEISACSSIDQSDLREHFAADQAGVKGLLLLKCLNFDQENKPILYYVNYFDTVFIKFTSIRSL
ncbi:MAG: GntR family transcriptional regulator [Halanaerobiales bacterium]|nr:GntR family transcriptional regulator [Halanaerobiales bacterium]